MLATNVSKTPDLQETRALFFHTTDPKIAIWDLFVFASAKGCIQWVRGDAYSARSDVGSPREAGTPGHFTNSACRPPVWERHSLQWWLCEKQPLPLKPSVYNNRHLRTHQAYWTEGALTALINDGLSTVWIHSLSDCSFVVSFVSGIYIIYSAPAQNRLLGEFFYSVPFLHTAISIAIKVQWDR